MPGRRRLSLHINRVAKENDKDAAPVDLTKVPLIVCGDFNALPTEEAVSQREMGLQTNCNTFCR